MNKQAHLYLQPVTNVFFLSSFTLYLTLLFSKKEGHVLPWYLSSYLGDFLCLPVLLGLSLFFLRVIKQNNSLFLSKMMIFVSFLYVSLLFEVFLPYFSVKYTADKLDVIAYASGGLIYYFVINHNKTKTLHHGYTTDTKHP